ncbi:hypothetical protein RHGRI_022299 [Rhododendron griersonianum]|uniref:Uncharacterized protein n=1 Tax=Rhododendron griersonianum TaxID=479676 RepID=A0AAV6J115_9ERIC|nr:hypothetical protein RHGRI_022299 [Rhododendron griersonianum]
MAKSSEAVGWAARDPSGILSPFKFPRRQYDVCNYEFYEASCLEDMLRRVEEELACCKVNNMEIDTRFNEIAEDKVQLELNLEVLFNEAEEAKKVCQCMEAERSVVKASYEEARSELRRSQ